MYQEFDKFVVSPQKNSWVPIENGFLAYLRKSTRHIKNSYHNTIDLASLSIDPKSQSQKKFTRFLTYLEQNNYNIFVENVLNDRLENFLSRRGYQCHNYQYSEPPYSWYRLHP